VENFDFDLIQVAMSYTRRVTVTHLVFFITSPRALGVADPTRLVRTQSSGLRDCSHLIEVASKSAFGNRAFQKRPCQIKSVPCQIKSGPLLIWRDLAGTLLEGVVAERTLRSFVRMPKRCQFPCSEIRT
jgi:hypothetical protein